MGAKAIAGKVRAGKSRLLQLEAIRTLYPATHRAKNRLVTTTLVSDLELREFRTCRRLIPPSYALLALNS